MADQLRFVDHSAIRTNQAIIIALLSASFITETPWLIALVSFLMLLGTALNRPAFKPLYIVLKAIRGFKPDILLDNPEPHRFAQGFGGVVLLGAAAAWLGGISSLSWALSWVVIALAALNLFGGFCLGCAVYYWLFRLGLPGFTKGPPSGTIPGQRPPAQG